MYEREGGVMNSPWAWVARHKHVLLVIGIGFSA